MVRDPRPQLPPFPSDFMFQLTDQKVTDLKSQIVISNSVP